MSDGRDVKQLTTAIEQGKGCTAMEMLSSVSMQERSTLMKDILAEHDSRRKQDTSLPLLSIEKPTVTGHDASDTYVRSSIERVNSGVNATNDILFNETTYPQFKQSIFRCTEMKSDGTRSTKTENKPFLEQLPKR